MALAATLPSIWATTIRGFGRNKVSFAVSLAAVGIAGATLYHLLHGIDAAKVVAAMKAQPVPHILLSAALVVAGYANLICYDLFALAAIGKRKIPLRVVAFASFTSYTIGHSLGAATVTCGLVRFRVYSFWNLNVVDIAKIAFVTGLTFWLGNIFVLGGAVAYRPDALGAFDQLPASINRLIGVAGLFAIGCYLVWLIPKPRVVGRANWRITLPNLQRTFLQTGIGSLDRCLASLSIFLLLPSSPGIGFATVVVVFVLATLLGAASHTPGSLGVVEAAVLVGLPRFPREDLVATLLTFRVLDFFLPLLLATVLFGIRELRLLARRAKAAQPRTPVIL
ncbi:MAG TPA: YbhN family protein [Xanthobacteraceae bacterium]|nr:YbhN family protein [Xanthobacteraceae bacterium]